MGKALGRGAVLGGKHRDAEELCKRGTIRIRGQRMYWVSVDPDEPRQYFRGLQRSCR